MSRPQEVSLARLLRVYESKAATSTSAASASASTPTRGSVASRPTSSDAPDDDWRASAKAHQHVEAMRGLLVQVRVHDPAAADAYAARVDRVEASLRPHRRPDYCLGSSSQAEWRPYKPPADVASTTPRQRKRPGAGSNPGPHGRSEGVKLTEDGQAALRRQRDLQEGLTDEMVDLAGSIRANAAAMERSLHQSRRELDQAETNLEKNLRGVKSANERQTKLKKMNRSGMCWTWIVLVIVGFVFAWTFVYVRITSDKVRRIG